jgi:hypothetical protein
MKQWFDLDKEEQEAVLARIADALKAKKLPHLDDAVLFQQSVLIYHGDENDDDAGYRVRAEKSKDHSLPKLGGELLYNQVMIIAEFLISPKMPPEALRVDFSKRLLAYLERKIPRAKLLGTKYQSTFTPQLRYFIGGLAEFARGHIRRYPDKGAYRRLPEELSTQKDGGGLFEILAKIAGGSKISDLAKEFQLAEGAADTLRKIRLEMMDEVSKAPLTQTDIDSLENIHTWVQCYYDWKDHQKALQEYLEHQEHLKKELSKH